MKKIIYPIVAALVLSGFSAMAQTNPVAENRNKPFINYHFHNQFTRHVPGEAIAHSGSHPTSVHLATELNRVDLLAPSFQSSDEQIDKQFTREETTIEIFNLQDADNIVASQFNTENGSKLADKALQASY